MTDNIQEQLEKQLNAAVEKGNLDGLKKSIAYLKDQLKIPEEVAKSAKTELEESFVKAKEAVSLVGGSLDDLAKIWGYQYGALLYNHLANRDSLQGREALSYIKMALGYELNAHGFTETQYSGFVLGVSLRFMLGFENLKKNIGRLEKELQKLESLPPDE